MSKKGYSLLPTDEIDLQDEDQENTIFSYDAYVAQGSTYNYRSIFTYNKYSDQIESEFVKETTSSPDRILARICHYFILFWSYLLLVLTFPCTGWFCIKKLSSNERLVLFRIGRLQPIQGPGFICVLPWIDKWHIVNVIIRGFIIPPQQLILRDGSIVEVGGEIRFRVEDVVKSVTSVQDLDQSVRNLGQTLLTDIIQQSTLQELQVDKQTISLKLHNRLKDITQKWGVNIVQVELSQPKILQNASSGSTSSPLGMLMSSLQAMLQKPTIDSNHSQRIPSQKLEENYIQSFITNTAFPAILSSGATLGQNGHIYKLEIEGKNGGVFWLDTSSGRTAVGDVSQTWGSPDVTVTLTDEDFMAIITSKTSPLQAYIAGQLKVSGNAKLLYDFQNILKKLQVAHNSNPSTSNASKNSTEIKIL